MEDLEKIRSRRLYSALGENSAIQAYNNVFGKGFLTEDDWGGQFNISKSTVT